MKLTSYGVKTGIPVYAVYRGYVEVHRVCSLCDNTGVVKTATKPPYIVMCPVCGNSSKHGNFDCYVPMKCVFEGYKKMEGSWDNEVLDFNLDSTVFKGIAEKLGRSSSKGNPDVFYTTYEEAVEECARLNELSLEEIREYRKW